VLRELAGALRLGLASHAERPRHLLLIGTGFIIGALVLILLLAIAAGFERLGDGTGAEDVAIVFAANARNESDSALTSETAALVAELPGVARDPDGHPVVAPQFIASTKLRRADGEIATVLVRGVTPVTWTLAGVHPASGASSRGIGVDGLMAGVAAARSFVALDAGARIKVRGRVWTVVDRFEAGGLWDSELWVDIASLQAAFNAPAALSVVWVKLDTPSAFAAFEAALDGDRRLRDVRTEVQRSYYARQVRFVSRFVRIAAIGIAVALGAGASLAINNALTLALIARRRELALLRALGYLRCILGVALLIEVVPIGLFATLVAIAMTWLILDGTAVGSSTGTQAVSFTLRVTPEVAMCALGYALLLGIVSAAWPAWQAVRAPLVAALNGD
jgi:putative ABC transport system permease protein